MIAQVVAWSVRHRALVLGATLVLALGGAVAGAQLKFDALPDITSNQVLILTRAPGLTPEEVERRVTRPIETVLGGLPGLVTHRSLSRYGISSITTVFGDDVDPYRARQVVQERINTVGGLLPSGVDAPELGPLTGGLGEIFHVTLRSPVRTPAELYELGQFRVAPLLRSISGVVEVNTWGGEQRSLEVDADPLRMAARGVTLTELRAALTHAVGTAPGASVDAAGGGQALLRAVAQPRTPSELAEALVTRGGGDQALPVRVADVAEVRTGALPRIGAATANGRGETVYLMAQMLRGENALDVMRAIHDRMPAVQAALPADVRIDVVYDRSVLVQKTLRTVGKNLVEGGVLVMVVLFAMLGSWRAGLLVASAIPLSMLGATSGMIAFGVAGNLMSLGAIDFGLVVDGAVVIVEQVFHSIHPSHDLSSRLAGEPFGFRERVSMAAQSVARPMFFSVLIILLVYVPVLSLTGVDGKMFRPMALTVVFALATSLLLSLTFVPAAASLFLRRSDLPERPPILVRAIERGYGPLLELARRHRAFVAAGAGLMLLAGVLLFARAGSEFVPQLDEGDLVVQTTRGSDIRLQTAVARAGDLERAALTLPEVRQVVSRIGSPAVATDIMGLEQADVFVQLRPPAEWRPGLREERERLIAELQKAFENNAPGADPSFTQPIQMRFNELLGGAVTDVTISVFGEDLTVLRRLAEQVAQTARGAAGVADVRVLAPPDVSLIEVVPHPLEAAQHGFTIAEVLESVQAVRTGLDVGTTYDGPIRVPVRLRMSGDATAFTLRDLPLPSATGGVVPLSRVADVRQIAAPALVTHDQGERRLLVGFNVRGADLGKAVEDARSRVERALKLPRGYRLSWGGQYETLQAATRRLTLVIPAVLVLILVVLLVAFRRFRPALLIFTNVPFACVGGMVALALRGMPVSISAAVGFIALSGIAVLNGVVLVSRVLTEEETAESAEVAAVRAAQARARPVLMTALVAALGFIPMMMAQGVGAEVQRPLATVVVGGLVTSTVLTLIILPVVYPWFARRRRAVA